MQIRKKYRKYSIENRKSYFVCVCVCVTYLRDLCVFSREFWMSLVWFGEERLLMDAHFQLNVITNVLQAVCGCLGALTVFAHMLGLELWCVFSQEMMPQAEDVTSFTKM